ncbi:hypothetical protein HY485_02125 [Candidatus Woesearchaeota archaeon]|nr:hypothetical protein [Candidatus Woesearchaeota archaeon]
MSITMSNNESRGLWRIIVLIAVITVALFFSKSSITGHISQDISRQPVDLVVGKSQSFVVSLPNNGEFSLRSLRVSGEVVGSGKVKVLLDNGKGIRRLVFANIHGVGKEIDRSTQFVESSDDLSQELVINSYQSLENDVADEGETIAGSFRSVCVETCNLNPDMFTSRRYELLVYVEPGAQAHINELLYT